MGNRAHDDLLRRYPWMRHTARGCHADGPPTWMKRDWTHRLRAQMRTLLHGAGTLDPPPHDPDATSYPTRAGDRWEWY